MNSYGFPGKYDKNHGGLWIVGSGGQTSIRCQEGNVEFEPGQMYEAIPGPGQIPDGKRGGQGGVWVSDFSWFHWEIHPQSHWFWCGKYCKYHYPRWYGKYLVITVGLFIWGFREEIHPKRSCLEVLVGQYYYWKTISDPIVKISDPLWEFWCLDTSLGTYLRKYFKIPEVVGTSQWRDAEFTGEVGPVGAAALPLKGGVDR